MVYKINGIEFDIPSLWNEFVYRNRLDSDARLFIQSRTKEHHTISVSEVHLPKSTHVGKLEVDQHLINSFPPSTYIDFELSNNAIRPLIAVASWEHASGFDYYAFVSRNNRLVRVTLGLSDLTHQVIAGATKTFARVVNSIRF